ncbi:nucleolar protein 12-like [Neltuma alba]|uniref:nucleolar protein 12-like n=1 Tax=Neltuma alba TaxID=207710 RepID=UPI0010A2CE63|nr:nucleolar protein 12-like [Prosopis alba]
MGKKKPKEPKESPKSSGASDIFSKLFGNVSEQGASSSLFSDSNPFRKKPLETSSSFGLTNNTENAGSAVSHSPDSEVLKKTKKRKEKNSSIDSDNAFEASGKKSKSGSDLNSHSIPKSITTPQDGEAKVSDLGAQATALSKNKNIVSEEGEEKGELVNGDKEKRKKNKRKRDDVEKEWELKRYGAVEEEQDHGEGLEKNVVGTKRKTVDNPADMLVTNEGFDDEKKLLRTIFIGNLPLKVKKKNLLVEFRKFGEVESVRIRSVPILDTKKPRKGAILAKKINDAGDSVHAYIVFKTEQSAQDSLSHNMAVIGGNHIRVDRACPPRKKLKGEHTPLYDNKRTVFVGNLPFDVKDEELYKLFSGTSNLESSIEAVRVIRDPHLNIGKGIAYVLFKTREAANFVVRKRNLKLRDRELRLCHARADATPSKRPNLSPPQASGTPAKKATMAARSPSSGNNRTNRKSNMSYQGLRANKTVVHKKSKTHGGEQTTERKTKRPAVAARKTKLKAKLLKEDGSSKHAGKKRKLDSRTPDSSVQSKKIKKNR